MAKVSVVIEEQLIEQAKIRAIVEKRSLAKLISDAVRKYLAEVES